MPARDEAPQSKVPGRSRRLARTAGLAVMAFAVSLARFGPAYAACPVERADYREREGIATLTFLARGGAAAASNRFNLLLTEGTSFEGLVMWSAEVPRPSAILFHKCPQGDATGAEIAGCTVWEGVIYAIDARGEVGLLPREGEDAPQRLILPDFGYAVARRAADAAIDLPRPPWDVFELEGCQQ